MAAEAGGVEARLRWQQLSLPGTRCDLSGDSPLPDYRVSLA
jgi:hypothetical protein